MRSWFFLPLLLVLPAGLGCGSTKTCTLVGCESTATIRMWANLDRVQMANATITACRNDSCSSGRPTTVPAAPGDRLAVSLAGPISVQGYLTSPDPVRGFKVEANFPLEGVAAQNGDVYELRVTPSGSPTPTTTVSERATYQDTQPNGPECPPVCRNATIDKTL